MIRFYQVDSTLPNYAGTGISVSVSWIYEHREQPLEIDYAEVIQDYEEARAITRTAEALSDPDDPFGSMFDDPAGVAEIAINELFTLEEAQALQQYLQEAHGLESTIKEAELPIPQVVMPSSLIPAGGDYDYIDLPGQETSPLPGRVYGLVDRSPALNRLEAMRTVANIRKALQAGMRPGMSEEELLDIYLKSTEEKPEEED